MPFSAITDTRRASSSFSVASRSVVLRPQRDNSVTSTASMCRAWASAITLRRSARSSFTPEPVSLNVPTTSYSDRLGERGKVSLLARAGLVGSRDPAIKGDALSQLNSPRWTPRKPLFLLGHGP